MPWTLVPFPRDKRRLQSKITNFSTRASYAPAEGILWNWVGYRRLDSKKLEWWAIGSRTKFDNISNLLHSSPSVDHECGTVCQLNSEHLQIRLCAPSSVISRPTCFSSSLRRLRCCWQVGSAPFVLRRCDWLVSSVPTINIQTYLLTYLLTYNTRTWVRDRRTDSRHTPDDRKDHAYA